MIFVPFIQVPLKGGKSITWACHAHIVTKVGDDFVGLCGQTWSASSDGAFYATAYFGGGECPHCTVALDGVTKLEAGPVEEAPGRQRGGDRPGARARRSVR